jgi:hypothetical protein
LTGGSRKTVEFTRKYNKPCLHIHSGVKDPEKRLLGFVVDNEIKILNVAWPRASNEPGLANFVREILEEAFPSRA